MVVLGAGHKEVGSARRDRAEHSEIGFLIFAQVVVGAVSHAGQVGVLVNDVGKNILGVVAPDGQDGPLFKADVELVVLRELGP